MNTTGKEIKRRTDMKNFNHRMKVVVEAEKRSKRKERREKVIHCFDIAFRILLFLLAIWMILDMLFTPQY